MQERVAFMPDVTETQCCFDEQTQSYAAVKLQPPTTNHASSVFTKIPQHVYSIAGPMPNAKHMINTEKLLKLDLPLLRENTPSHDSCTGGAIHTALARENEATLQRITRGSSS